MATMRPRSYLIGVFLLLSLLTTHCVAISEPSVSPSAATVPPAPAEPLTLQLYTPYPGSNLGEAEQIILDGWMAANPGVEAELVAAWDFAQTYLARATPPDVIGVFPAYELAEIIHKEQAVDLAEAWTASGLFEGLPVSWQMAMSQYESQVYFPVVYSWQAIYYNKAIFAEHDLTPPQSWAEFVELCATLHELGITPLALDGAVDGTGMLWFEMLNLRLNGPRFHYELLGGQTSFDDERVRNVFTLWQGLFENDYFVESPTELDRMSSLFAILGPEKAPDGPKAAMTLSESWWLTELAPEDWDEIAFFRFPIIDEAVPVTEMVYSYGYIIPTGSIHQEEALSLLAAFGTVEAQNTWLQPEIHNPFFAPMRTDFEFEQLAPALQQPMAMIETADEVVEPLIYALPAPLRSRIGPAFRQFMNDPQTIDDFVAAMEAGRQAAQEQGLFLTQ